MRGLGDPGAEPSLWLTAMALCGPGRCCAGCERPFTAARGPMAWITVSQPGQHDVALLCGACASQGPSTIVRRRLAAMGITGAEVVPVAAGGRA